MMHEQFSAGGTSPEDTRLGWFIGGILLGAVLGLVGGHALWPAPGEPSPAAAPASSAAVVAPGPLSTPAPVSDLPAPAVPAPPVREPAPSRPVETGAVPPTAPSPSPGPAAAPGGMPPIAELPHSSLDLRLVGTMMGETAAESFALIQQPGAGGQGIYSVGDRVAPNATVEVIGDEFIVVLHEGRWEKLRLSPPEP